MTYTYNIEETFKNGLATDSLSLTIQQSSITIGLEGINTDSTDCYIVFKDQLSSGELTTLNTIISEHDGKPLTQEQIIKTIPLLANYKGKSLYKKGYVGICIKNSTTNFDVSFPDERLLFGGEYNIIGNISTDSTLEAKVGVIYGETFYPVYNIVDTIPIKYFPKANIKCDSAATTLPGYVTFRVSVFNGSNEDYEIGFNVEAWK